jgi:signal transduction histidine kinase
MTELLQQDGTPEELQEYWQILESELNRQKILIDRLLIAGRLESGMMSMEHVPLDLIAVLEDSIRSVKPIAKKRSIHVNLINGEHPAKTMGDKSALQQVFINLLNNAVKFSPEGREVQVELYNSDEMINVRITDHGMGIPEEAIPHLFERFYRAKNVSIAEIPGSGIGLYIVKSIVEGMGGVIQVQSKLNEGTIFIVSLMLIN